MARPEPRPRYLIIRRDNIGDLACTTPLLDGLRRAHPQAWIGALVNTYNAEVLARNPAVDRVFAYEKLKHRQGGSVLGSVYRRLRDLLELRALDLDAVLVPAPTPRTLRLAAMLGPRQVIAAPSSAGDGRHEVERVFELGRALGVAGEPGPMRVYPDPRVQASLRAQFGDGPFVAVHISARRPSQRWPVERYEALIAELTRRSQVMLLWAPGPQDDPRHPGDDDKALRLTKPGVVAVPTPRLEVLVAALSLAERVICPDGGAMHLAAALGKPVVALFGDSPVARWRPWGVRRRVLNPASGTLAELAPSEVLEAAAELA